MSNLPRATGPELIIKDTELRTLVQQGLNEILVEFQLTNYDKKLKEEYTFSENIQKTIVAGIRRYQSTDIDLSVITSLINKPEGL